MSLWKGGGQKMPRQKDVRTLKMMENYVECFNQGMTPKEIAEKFEVSYTTVKKNLGEIAEKAGVPRSELLTRHFIADHSGQNFSIVKPIDAEASNRACKEIRKGIDNLRTSLRNSIEEIELSEQLDDEEWGVK